MSVIACTDPVQPLIRPISVLLTRASVSFGFNGRSSWFFYKTAPSGTIDIVICFDWLAISSLVFIENYEKDFKKNEIICINFFFFFNEILMVMIDNVIITFG